MPQWWEDYDPAVDDDPCKPDSDDKGFEDLDPRRDPLSDLVYDVPDDDASLPLIGQVAFAGQSSLARLNHARRSVSLQRRTGCHRSLE